MPEEEGSQEAGTLRQFRSSSNECDMLHGPQSMVLPTYTSFLDSCWIDTDYPKFSLLSDLHEVEDIQDLNCLDFQEMDGVEAWATGSSNKEQWIFDSGATDHMSGSLVQNTSCTSATVTGAGRQKLKISGVSEASLQTP